MKPPPHENTLLAAEEDQTRRSDENQASFLSHTRFLDFQGAPDPPLSPPSVEASLWRWEKEKRAGHDGKEKDCCYFY